MQTIAATNNPHKIREFRRLLSPIEIVTPQECGFEFHCVEDGVSFCENALKKAAACARQSTTDSPVIADDSGICVVALGGAPGIYSARFGSEMQRPPINDAGRTQLLFERMPFDIDDRSAYYVCAMVLYYNSTRFYMAQEVWHGAIAHHISQSKGGFGYDPIFYLPELGRCASELTDNEKDTYSHRGRAARALLKML